MAPAVTVGDLLQLLALPQRNGRWHEENRDPRMRHGNEGRVEPREPRGRTDGAGRSPKADGRSWPISERRDGLCVLVLLLMKRGGLNEEGGWEVSGQFHVQG